MSGNVEHSSVRSKAEHSTAERNRNQIGQDLKNRCGEQSINPSRKEGRMTGFLCKRYNFTLHRLIKLNYICNVDIDFTVPSGTENTG